MTAPDPTILAEAIKKAEADLQTFRGIDDPEIKKLVEFCEVILVAARAYQPWQPIETAPKDGTVVDLWILGPDHMVDFYAPQATKIRGKPLRHGRTTGMRWQHRPRNKPNWYPMDGLGYPLSPEVTPTHWMPLPAPPIERAEREPILEKLRSLSTDAARIKGTPMVPLHKSTVAAAADEIERLYAALQLYAGLAGRLYATLEFAVSDLEAALAVIPDHQEIVRRRLTLRVSATKEFLDQNRILPAAALNPAGPA